VNTSVLKTVNPNCLLQQESGQQPYLRHRAEGTLAWNNGSNLTERRGVTVDGGPQCSGRLDFA
jgi:hypothetical protein